MVQQTSEAGYFLPMVDTADAPDDLRQLLEGYAKRMGFMPNALRLYLHRPHIQSAIIALNNAVMRHSANELSEEFKYRMSFIISRDHGCRYCCAHHAYVLRQRWKLDDDDLEGILLLADPRDERERVAWDFAHAAARGPENVTAAHHRELAEHFSPNEIVEIACTLGFWAFYNRIHSSLAVPLEDILADESHWVDTPGPAAADGP